MATGDDLRRLALTLAGTTESPHVDRAAFRVARIYATLAADGLTANLKLSPEEQEFHGLLRPEAVTPVPNAWGAKGWTTLTLASLDEAALRSLLEIAWAHARPTPKRKARPRR